jgi:hypothetical protein
VNVSVAINRKTLNITGSSGLINTVASWLKGIGCDYIEKALVKVINEKLASTANPLIAKTDGLLCLLDALPGHSCSDVGHAPLTPAFILKDMWLDW